MCSYNRPRACPDGATGRRHQASSTSLGDFPQYLDALRARKPSINVAQFVGHGALRLATVGPENRPVTPDDLRRMEHLLAEAIDAGAYGYSTGLVYPPSAYSATPELIALARSMARRGGLYFSHVRGESAMVEDSIREAIRIGEESGVGVQIAHVKVGAGLGQDGSSAPHRRGGRRRRDGRRLPYHAGSTKMDNLMPSWAHDGGIPKLLERLADRTIRRRIMEECLVDGERWRTVSQGAVGFDEIQISTCRRHEVEGLTLAALARQTGRTPAEALMDLLLEQKATVGMVSFSQNLENVAKVLAHPAIMIGSDSIGLSEGEGPRHGKPHPRMYGTFPRVLGEYARERGRFSLETRSTDDRHARRALGLKTRGAAAGYAASTVSIRPPCGTSRPMPIRTATRRGFPT
jgi:N-acyl-D-amino-acid deacylase